MKRFEMDFNDSPYGAEYLSLLPERGVCLDIFGKGLNTQGAAGDITAYDSQAINTLQQYIQQAAQTMQPWVTGGGAAEGALGSYLGLAGSPQINPTQQLTQTPGYQFNLGQGLNALESYGAARGLGSSGAAKTGAQTYGAGLAQNTYQQYLNNLMGMSNTGEGAAGTTAGAYMTGGADIANILQGEGSNLAGANLAGQSSGGMGSGMLSQILGLLMGSGAGQGLSSLISSGASGLSSLFSGGGGNAYNAGGGGAAPTMSWLNAIPAVVSSF